MDQLSMDQGDISQILSELRGRFSWLEAKWVPLERPLHFDFYQNWISDGLHGEMDYLRRHLPLKEDASGLLTSARSILVVSKSYVPAVREHHKLENLRIASYARNEDYHEWFGDELKEAAAFLETRLPGIKCRAGVDSLPVMERDHAARAGLGWAGKNTCLIHRQEGSFFFLGEILSTAVVQTEFAPLPDFCGTCNRCIEICPTNAIVEPRKLDATKCISYWTIESKKTPPPELAEKFGDWFFGCDLCQSICPWNQKAFKGKLTLETQTLRDLNGDVEKDLTWILTASDEELRRELKNSPLGRAKAFGLRRNAIIAATNLKIASLKAAIEQYMSDPELAELARWGSEKLAKL